MNFSRSGLPPHRCSFMKAQVNRNIDITRKVVATVGYSIQPSGEMFLLPLGELLRWKLLSDVEKQLSDGAIVHRRPRLPLLQLARDHHLRRLRQGLGWPPWVAPQNAALDKPHPPVVSSSDRDGASHKSDSIRPSHIRHL